MTDSSMFKELQKLGHPSVLLTLQVIDNAKMQDDVAVILANSARRSMRKIVGDLFVFVSKNGASTMIPGGESGRQAASKLGKSLVVLSVNPTDKDAFYTFRENSDSYGPTLRKVVQLLSTSAHPDIQKIIRVLNLLENHAYYMGITG